MCVGGGVLGKRGIKTKQSHYSMLSIINSSPTQEQTIYIEIAQLTQIFRAKKNWFFNSVLHQTIPVNLQTHTLTRAHFACYPMEIENKQKYTLCTPLDLSKSLLYVVFFLNAQRMESLTSHLISLNSLFFDLFFCIDFFPYSLVSMRRRF